MAYDLEEQEQIAAIKSWWNEYGNLVILTVVAAALSFAAFNGWRYYRHHQALGAVTLYEQLDKAERAADHKKVRDIAGKITADYASTAYSGYAALSAANASFQMNDLAGARAQLQWAIDNTRDDELRDVARLRLAGVLLDEKKHDEALKLLDVKPVDSLAGLYSDLRGDVFLAQGKRGDARKAYEAALEKTESGSPYRPVIQIKLDSLGGS